jgi:hypothetical protein
LCLLTAKLATIDDCLPPKDLLSNCLKVYDGY